MTNNQTITLSQAEFAAYQRAVELAKAEIARLTAELAGMHREYEQQQRALEAERRARAVVEADVAAYRRIIDVLSRAGDIESMRGVASAALVTFRPGAALLAELDAARAVVECYREEPRYYDDCDPGQNDPYYDWAAHMRDLLATYDAAVKASEP